MPLTLPQAEEGAAGSAASAVWGLRRGACGQLGHHAGTKMMELTPATQQVASFS